MIPTGYLRVYLPGEVVEQTLGKLPMVSGENPTAVRQEGELGLVATSMTDSQLVLRHGNRDFVCPRLPRLRAAEGLLALRNAFAEIGGDFLIPERVAETARAEVLRHRDQPMMRSYILASPWHIPFRWFLAFEPDERELSGEPDEVTIRYVAEMQDALDRLDSILDVLRESGVDDFVVGEVEELQGWLSGFPGESLVELDYAQVARLFTDEALVMDESCADLWNAVQALALDEWESAMEHYVEVANRWSGPMSVSFSS